jgi:AcrR family transcriptional regulator
MRATTRQIRDVSYERRRASILKAARDAFSRLGFAAATVDDVAERAGIAKGTLYLYFRSKEEIYLACLLEEVHELMRRSREEMEAKPDLRSKLAAYFRVRFEFCEKHEAFYRIYQAEYSGLFMKSRAIPREFRVLLEQSLDYMTEVMERAIKAGEIRKVPARSAASAVLDMSRGIAEKRLLGFSHLTPSAENDFLVDLIWRGLAPESKQQRMRQQGKRQQKAGHA